MQCIDAGTDNYFSIAVNKHIRLRLVLWTLQWNLENPSIGQVFMEASKPVGLQFLLR